jgi:hypothetical protein
MDDQPTATTNSATAAIANGPPSHARKLIIATLALVVCRIISAWDSMAAGSAALVILAILAASIVAGMPRVRRLMLYVALPVAVLLNAVVFAVGAFVTLLGVQGLLADGRIGSGPPWSWVFVAVPLAAAANIVALAYPHSSPRWRRCAWLANLASACYVGWQWRSDDPVMMGFAVPIAATALIGLAILSLATIAWDTRHQASVQPVRPLRQPRRIRMLWTAGMVSVLFWLALVPVYRTRQIAHSLDALGLRANFGIVFPAWRLPFELPFDWYDYLGEVTGVWARKPFTGDKMDAGEAGRLLSTLPWLNFVDVNGFPADGERLFQPLAGHKRLNQIVLAGPEVTDETLGVVGKLPALTRAQFMKARFTDDGLAHLAGAKWLQYLAIRQTPISGDGLSHLKSLPRLTELDLSGTGLGDRQVTVLAEFKTLSTLSLCATPISDEGLSALAKCKTLRSIDLHGTRVTAGGVQRLERALPGCSVFWNRTAEEP